MRALRRVCCACALAALFYGIIRAGNTGETWFIVGPALVLWVLAVTFPLEGDGKQGDRDG